MNNATTPDPAHPFAPGFPEAFAQRVHYILTGLAFVVAARYRILGPVTVLLWTRLNRAHRRISNLIARLAAGRLHQSRLRPSRPSKTPDQTPATRHGGPRGPHLPRTYFWLVRTLGYEAAAYRTMLEALLLDPGTAALLAAAPTAARTLRPLCRILGIELVPALQPAPRPAPISAPATAPRPPRAKPQAPPRRQRPRLVLNAITPTLHRRAKPA